MALLEEYIAKELDELRSQGVVSPDAGRPRPALARRPRRGRPDHERDRPRDQPRS